MGINEGGKMISFFKSEGIIFYHYLYKNVDDDNNKVKGEKNLYKKKG